MKTTYTLRSLIMLLIFAAGFSFTASAQRGLGNSSAVLEVPLDAGVAAIATTQIPSAGGYDILGHVEMASIWDDSHKVKAPDTTESTAMMMGELHINTCDSYPPCPGEEKKFGIILGLQNGEYMIIAGLDSASVANNGISTGSTVVPGQELGFMDDNNNLHIEIYVPNAAGQILDANGWVIRDWQYGFKGRTAYKYDSHNRKPRFCVGTKVRTLSDGETVMGGSCSLTSGGGTAGSKTNELDLNTQLINSVTVYPQPASGSAKMALDLNDDTPVSLSLLDLSGRTVATPVTGKMFNAGSHEINLNLSNLKAGLYLYHLTTDQGMTTGKIVVTQ